MARYHQRPILHNHQHRLAVVFIFIIIDITKSACSVKFSIRVYCGQVLPCNLRVIAACNPYRLKKSIGAAVTVPCLCMLACNRCAIFGCRTTQLDSCSSTTQGLIRCVPYQHVAIL